MKLEEALIEVLKDSPPNAAIRKMDLEKAVALMAGKPEEKKPEPEQPAD